jgi:cytochrome c553
MGIVYAASSTILRRKHEVPLVAAPPRGGTAEVPEGRRLAVLLGCLEGCHGRQGEGTVLVEPGLFRIGTPNLGRVVPEYSDAELVRLLRFGVRRDGTSPLLMPAGTFFPLADADLARLLAFLRSLPSAAGPAQEPPRELSLKARLGIVLGMFPTSAGEVDPSRPRWGELPRTTPYERGRYWASITCSECHGLDLRGEEFEGSPSLAIVAAAYGLDQFRHLLRTGEPVSKRDLGIMSEVARDAFSSFRDDEIDDLYLFLKVEFGAPSRGHAPVHPNQSQ